MARRCGADDPGQSQPPAATVLQSELNPVENIWEYLRQNQLSLRVWPGFEAIVETCCQAWNAPMAMPEWIASITCREWARPVIA